MKVKSLLIFIVLSLLSLSLSAKDGDPDISEEDRLAVIEQKLKENPKHLLVYVKGLVCSSCGIGVRVHLRKLKGIDKKQLNKGVDLDVNTQLATIALLDDHSISPEAISKAVRKAGYKPKQLYRWDGKTIIKTQLQ